MINYNKFLIIGLLSGFLIVGDVAAQSENKATISGRVVNYNTGLPLSYVNVFLANTTKGSTTNDDGHFLIRGVPPFGSYELVASMMGFETQSQLIKLIKSDTLKVDFRLRPKVIQMQEVVLEAPDAKKWRKNLEIFKVELLGKTGNAFECVILNPEVINFRIERNPYSLYAETDVPLEIINHALGYKIHTILNYFKFENETCYYETKLQFVEIEAENTNQKKRWIENRTKAYNGSLRHFIAALTGLRLRAEGFSMYKRSILDNDHNDSYLDKKHQLSLLQLGLHPFERRLKFKNYLKIIYKNEEDEIHSRNFQESFITLLQDEVTITTSGQIYEVLAVVNYGRWGEERLAEELPLDYEPSKD